MTARGSSGDISGNHVYADDGDYQVQVCVENLLRIEVCDTLQVTVSNLAPTVTATMVPADPVDHGAPARLVVDFDDAGTADTHEAEIDWGDGSPLETMAVIEAPFGPPGDTAGMNGQLQVDHQYATNDDYTGEVCIVDDDGDRSCEEFSLTTGIDGPPACRIIVDPVQCTDSTATIPLEVILENTENQPAVVLWTSDNPNGVFIDLVNNDFSDPTSRTPTLVTNASVGFNVMVEGVFSDLSGLGSVTCQQYIPSCGTSDLSLAKIVNNTMPIVSEHVVFTLAVTNDGPDDATGVIVSDVLPSGVSFVTDSGGGNYIPETGLWTIGSLANSDTILIDITVSVDVAGSLVNIAGIEFSDQADPDSTPRNDDGDQSEDDEDRSTLQARGEPTQIPTLGEWSLVLFIGLLMLAGWHHAQRRNQGIGLR